MFMFLPLVLPALNGLWLVIIIIKTFVEFLALTQAAFIFSKKKLIPWFLLFQFIYPIYVIMFSLLGALQIYEWKK